MRKAKSEGVNVQNGLTPEAQFPNALSSVKSLEQDTSTVNSSPAPIRRTNDTFVTPDFIEQYE